MAYLSLPDAYVMHALLRTFPQIPGSELFPRKLTMVLTHILHRVYTMMWTEWVRKQPEDCFHQFHDNDDVNASSDIRELLAIEYNDESLSNSELIEAANLQQVALASTIRSQGSLGLNSHNHSWFAALCQSESTAIQEYLPFKLQFPEAQSLISVDFINSLPFWLENPPLALYFIMKMAANQLLNPKVTSELSPFRTTHEDEDLAQRITRLRNAAQLLKLAALDNAVNVVRMIVTGLTKSDLHVVLMSSHGQSYESVLQYLVEQHLHFAVIPSIVNLILLELPEQFCRSCMFYSSIELWGSSPTMESASALSDLHIINVTALKTLKYGESWGTRVEPTPAPPCDVCRSFPAKRWSTTITEELLMNVDRFYLEQSQQNASHKIVTTAATTYVNNSGIGLSNATLPRAKPTEWAFIFQAGKEKEEEEGDVGWRMQGSWTKRKKKQEKEKKWEKKHKEQQKKVQEEEIIEEGWRWRHPGYGKLWTKVSGPEVDYLVHRPPQ